ncbi:hypothetical protein BASA50_011120 [Batrachochytrium salamandrivorans]|uniref:Glycolipid transfer protein domain-containing protein n=1 Tax=Batrachochytrium salamandrivorans TaxID=1357716 RepID=A0ABQ8EWM9_9FUNG|nr:hypothetical protein BASA50_011120 [Batrachochytrium salamandrivorans]KAH9272545.1 hypothetical protein BASA83_005045 [Batrachochytrium salamandrivorans]KAJ1341658.1 hypothetical protein BSLG_003770 [Batrachochytrium salamandrivorans]KAJ1342665.1 hypothetical protein BSLG_002763 [Batrachochytrium salamandrivorans]
MATFFDTLSSSYTTIVVASSDNGIPTVQFLDSTNSLTKLFDTLGAAFSVVSSDMHGNITKIRTRFDQNAARSGTLQELVNAERADNSGKAADALLWLKRGLEFTAMGLRRNLDNPSEELSTSFNKAYEGTLSRHHNFMIRGVFSLAMKACPSRVDFYAKLSRSDPAKMKEQLVAWLSALETQVSIINQFLKANGIEK